MIFLAADERWVAHHGIETMLAIPSDKDFWERDRPVQRVARWGAVWTPGVEAQLGTDAGTVLGFTLVRCLKGIDELHDDIGIGFNPSGERCARIAFASGAQGCTG